MASAVRPRVEGKFLFRGDEKVYVRGVTYGTFRPGATGSDYPDGATLERDFAQMAANGLNAVRTYTVPPAAVLDSAQDHGLAVMVGLPWEQHVTFLDEKPRVRSIEERVREGVRQCAGHPAVLGYAVGNEIPAPIVRWHGRRPVERHIRRLYEAAKEEDPDGLVTYVNYPTTEYLELPFVDFLCFNVYLEGRRSLEAYLARLQNIAGERPLVMAEIGLDSRTHGERAQAETLGWQIDAASKAGCAGAFVFAWTDEWHRGGYDIEDWDFGLVDRKRRPKPALGSVAKAFAQVPVSIETSWLRITVVVCSYNGESTIRDCLEGLRTLDYPNYEVVVVDDGSTDRTAAIASEYGVRVISTENRGLSSARNTGIEAATGEIVAFIDDDARPDRHWLTYLALAFSGTSHAGIGGPNIPPSDACEVADCVANAPGAPMHVLLGDQEAEHIPGCNSAYRKAALQAIGGFDPQFWVAGDDVDACWRLRDRGFTLGFSPAAMVWHQRRNSIAAYWRHQAGYGRAEAILERKWPQKYNTLGHLAWGGRMYGRGLTHAFARRKARVHHGTWGTGLFQRLYQQPDATLRSLALVPEWYLLIVLLAALTALGALWSPLLTALPLLALAAAAPVAQACLSASKADFPKCRYSLRTRLKLRTLTTLLYLLQPAARLWGRLGEGLTPWRRRGPRPAAMPRPRTFAVWSESWRSPRDRLSDIEGRLQQEGATVLRGGAFDRWDLEVRAGMMGAARSLMAVEEHGAGKQLARLRTWPKVPVHGAVVVVALCGLSVGAGVSRAWLASAILALGGLVLLAISVYECGVGVGAIGRAVGEPAARAAAPGEPTPQPASRWQARPEESR